MKSLIMDVKVLAGASVKEVVYALIDLAEENDVMVRTNFNGVDVTALPTSDASELIGQVKKSLGIK